MVLISLQVTVRFDFNISQISFSNILTLDEEVEVEMRNFKKTLHEEVFSKKIGQNPPLIVQPEEVPIISEVLDETEKLQKEEKFPLKKLQLPKVDNQESDDEVKPENYLFSNDS